MECIIITGKRQGYAGRAGLDWGGCQAGTEILFWCHCEYSEALSKKDRFADCGASQ